MQNAKKLSVKSLIEEMDHLNIKGPRGIIKFDKDTNRTTFNHYIYELNLDSLNNISFRKIETLVNDGHFIKALSSITKPDHQSGWHNAYLCH